LITIYNLKTLSSLLKSALSGALVAYFIQNLFVFDMPVTLLVFFFIVGIAMAGGGDYEIFKKIQKTISNKILVSVALVVLIAAIVPLVILPTKESKLRYTMVRDMTLSEYPSQREKVNGISFMGTSGEDVTSSIRALTIIRENMAQMTPKNQKIFIDAVQSTKDSLLKSLEREPESLKLHYGIGFAGRILSLVMETDPKKISSEQREVLREASKHLDKALSINPHYPEIYLLNAQIHYILGDNKGVTKMVREVRKIKPDFADQITSREKGSIDVHVISSEDSGFRRTTSCEAKK
jgi:tetratricopeptide (TPR) repeat protein